MRTPGRHSSLRRQPGVDPRHKTIREHSGDLHTINRVWTPRDRRLRALLRERVCDFRQYAPKLVLLRSYRFLPATSGGRTGPVLPLARAQHDIAFSCVAYMSSSLSLIDPSLTREDLLLRVGEGLHSVHLYAREYWLEHLLAYARENVGLKGVKSTPLYGQLTTLYEKHQDLEKVLSRTTHQNSVNGSEAILYERLGYFLEHAGVPLSSVVYS